MFGTTYTIFTLLILFVKWFHMGEHNAGKGPAYILEAALKVFARHGFKKTSIEDLAKGAGVSRQTIYSHFKSKEEVFKASLRKSLEDGLFAASKALDNADRSLEEKLLDALDEWFGRHVGLFHIEASDIRQQSQLLLGDVLGEYRAPLQKKMVKLIAASSARKSKVAQLKLATDIAQTLFACGFAWKHDLASREEFQEKMETAIRLCCRSLYLDQ